MKVFSQVSVDKICSNIANHINKSQGTQKVLKKIGKNPAIFSAVTAFGMASILRPTIIGALPFKNNKDKKCSQASAVASGLTDLVTTAAIFIPLNKGIEKVSRALYESKGTFYSENKEGLRQFKSISNRGAKLLLLIPISIARVALIKPLMDNLFKDKKKPTERKLDKWA